jgi:4-hydroxy-3-methylbut-2-enyl diphosphate reductase
VHFDLHLKAEKTSYSGKLAGEEPITIGITAGASCPNNLIEDTLLRIFALRGITSDQVKESVGL